VLEEIFFSNDSTWHKDVPAIEREAAQQLEINSLIKQFSDLKAKAADCQRQRICGIKTDK
jgi:hypothetical protein